eukprot:GHRQ01008843.1.p1 GENE.GHRQ01008843.1~~GHRQ01008843.1.p1  ORF type:complete len:183 (+),score=45.45 GHRQ01008843.1:406-954(+)
MAMSSLQWSAVVVLAAVGFFYINDPRSFQSSLAGLFSKVGIAEVRHVQLYYNVTVRDNSGNEQNFLYNHTVEAARIAAALKDPSSRLELTKEITTPHIPEMLAAKHWKCAVCKMDATMLLLHPLPDHLMLDPPLLKDFGGVAVCGSDSCQDSAGGMMYSLYDDVMKASGMEVPDDGGIVEVY